MTRRTGEYSNMRVMRDRRGLVKGGNIRHDTQGEGVQEFEAAIQ